MNYPRIVKDLGYFYSNCSMSDKEKLVAKLTKEGYRVKIAPAYTPYKNQMADCCSIFIENYRDYFEHLVADSLGLEITSLTHPVITNEGMFYKNVDAMTVIGYLIDRNNEYTDMDGKRGNEKKRLAELDKTYGITFGESYHPVNKGAVQGFFGDKKTSTTQGVYIKDYEHFLQDGRQLLDDWIQIDQERLLEEKEYKSLEHASYKVKK